MTTPTTSRPARVQLDLWGGRQTKVAAEASGVSVARERGVERGCVELSRREPKAARSEADVLSRDAHGDTWFARGRSRTCDRLGRFLPPEGELVFEFCVSQSKTPGSWADSFDSRVHQSCQSIPSSARSNGSRKEGSNLVQDLEITVPAPPNAISAVLRNAVAAEPPWPNFDGDRTRACHCGQGSRSAIPRPDEAHAEGCLCDVCLC
jgi:hypothetical protein